MIHEFETDLNDVPVVVSYEYVPPNGDGWHNPKFSGYVMIHEIKDNAGNVIELNDDDESELADEIQEAINSRAMEDAADEEYRRKRNY